MSSDFVAFFPHTVLHHPWTGQEDDGTPRHDAPQAVRARIAAEVSKTTNVPGEEQQQAYSTVLVQPVSVAGRAVVPSPRDLLVLPAEFATGPVPIVAVKRIDDERGVHHYRLRVLLQESTLQRRITLQRPVRIQDPATGEEIVTYTDVAVRMADVRPLPGEEIAAGFQVQAWGLAVFRLAFFTYEGQLPTPEWRVGCGGRLYDVLDVRPLGQCEQLELLGKARAE